MKFLLVLLVIVNYALAEHSESDQAKAGAGTEKAKRTVVTVEEKHVSEGAWYLKEKKPVAYIYYDAKDYPHVAEEFKVATEAGSFQDKQGVKVEYRKGDIIFKISDGSTYRARPTEKQLTELRLPVVDQQGKPKQSQVLFAPGEAPIEITPWERDTIQKANELRATEGLFPLLVSPHLIREARLKAKNMATHNSMSHGWAPTGYRENISSGVSDAEGAANQWWLSRSEQGHPGISHYKNMKAGTPNIGVGQSFENPTRTVYSAMLFQ